MKTESVENVVVDEAHCRTYVVMADRILTDGELYRAIRVEILRRGNALSKGERVVISHSSPRKAAPQADSLSNAGSGFSGPTAKTTPPEEIQCED